MRNSDALLWGLLLGISLCIIAIKFREMRSDIDWCRVYVDQHLASEQREARKKRNEATG